MNSANQEVQTDYSPWLEFKKRFFQQKPAVCGFVFVLILFLSAVFAP